MPTVQLEPGSPQETSVIVQSANVPDSIDDPLMVRDVGGEGPSELQVVFGTPEALTVTGSGRAWRVPVSVSGMPPGSRLTRTASPALGDSFGGLVDFTLSNVVPNLTWQLTGPPEELVLGTDTADRRTSSAVTSGDAPLAGLRIVQSELQDESTKRQLGTDYLRLYGPTTIERRSTQGVSLGVNREFFGPGTFSGSVMLAVDGTPETRSFDLTVHSSSRAWKWGGIGAISFGVAIMLFLTVFSKGAIFRAEARRLAELLRGRLTPLEKPINAAEAEFPPDGKKPDLDLSKLRSELRKAKERVSKDGLDEVLAGLPSEGKAEAVKTHFASVSNAATVLDEITARGVGEVLRRWKSVKETAAVRGSTFGTADPVPFITALNKLGELADQAEKKDPAKTRKGVDQVLDSLSQAPQVAQAQPGLTPPPLRGQDHGSASLAIIRGFVWLAFFAVTVFAGWMLLIVPNPGFGTPHDLGICLLWGLGLPTGGQQLQQLVPSAVASHLRIPLPSGD
jgi:hypothetical protein